jgi:hypothetical protein
MVDRDCILVQKCLIQATGLAPGLPQYIAAKPTGFTPQSHLRYGHPNHAQRGVRNFALEKVLEIVEHPLLFQRVSDDPGKRLVSPKTKKYICK